MKNSILSISLLLILCVNVFAQTEEEINKKVKELVSKMSLTAKCGEMSQFTLDALMDGPAYQVPEPQVLDVEKLNHVLVELQAGSILNVSGHSLTRNRFHSILDTIQEWALIKKESGIPVLFGIDATHGAGYTTDATLFPHQIGMAATWNRDLIREGASVVSYEVRASGIPWNFSPVMDIGRDQRWPRLYESFGEDVYLSSEIGKAVVQGYQGDGMNSPYKIAACLKHFLGYSVTLSGKDRTQAWVPERQLREYFLPGFERAMDEGALTVMINSGEMNGIPVHINHDILTKLLKEELGFKGFAVSDWEDIRYLFTRHKVAKDHKEAIKLAINAGLDMSMIPLDTEFPVLLKELVEEGEIPMSRIDDAVSRILYVKFKLGLFDAPRPKNVNYDKFASEEHRMAAYNTAVESISLLKNEDNILPLKSSQKILVTGPAANSLNFLNGGWTHTWQGTDTVYNDESKFTIKEALEKNFANVSYAAGTSYKEVVDIKDAVAKAQMSDVIVACIGEHPYTEFVGSIDEMDLPDAQFELINELAKTGKPIVLVVVGGRPRIIRDMVAQSDAVFMAWLPGNEGGLAIADLIAGKQNPSGKLPVTYPQYSNDLLTYDHKYTNGLHTDFSMNAFRPQFEFGAGMSYTTFEYSNLKLSESKINKNGKVTISVDVKNAGDRSGKEVVQLYVSDLVASITPSVKRLRGFEKIELAAGETKTVSFTIFASDLAFVNANNEWEVEPGDFKIKIADLEEDLLIDNF